MRLWVLPSGLCPRRVTIYLKEKGILDEFDIIPIEITADGQSYSPGKPPGSLPILEICPPSTDEALDGKYIFQSAAILEYLEDVYGPKFGTPNMRGFSPEDRAKVRDCMNILCEATDFFGFYCHNASKLFATVEEQSPDAAKMAIARVHHMLSLVEKLADPGGPWLAGSSGTPTIADCVAMSTMQFAEAVYGYNLTEGHPRLKQVYDAFAVRESSKMEEVPEFAKQLAPVLSVR